MTPDTFYRKIARNTGVSLSDVKKVIREQANIIQEVVATNDSIQLKFGTIRGVDKYPTRCGTKLTAAGYQMPQYTKWKHGVPIIEWSQHMKECETTPPEVYFDLPENRLTTDAFKFREIMEIPDPLEVQNKTEEELKQIKAVADEAKLASLHGRDKKTAILRGKRLVKQQKLSYKYWVSIGYVPFGITADNKYKSDQRD